MTVKKAKSKARKLDPRQEQENLVRKLITSRILEDVELSGETLGSADRAELVDFVADQLLEPLLMLVENMVTTALVLGAEDEDEDEDENEDEEGVEK